MKRFVTLLLALSLVVGALSACTSSSGGSASDDTSVVSAIDNPNKVDKLENADNVVMEYEGRTLSSGMYAFIFSYLKTLYLSTLQYYSDSYYVEDTKAFWSTSAGELTYAEAVVGDINEHCMMLLICDKIASEYGVVLGSEEAEQAGQELNELVADYGSVDKFNDYLARFGIDCDDVEAYLNQKYMITVVQDKLCSSGGVCEISDDDVKSKINESYRKTKHLYLSDSAFDGDANAKANEIIAALENGADFADYVSLSGDTAAQTYPDGIMVNLATTDDRYASVAADLDAGECGICAFDEGVYLIVGVEITDDDIEGVYQTVFSSLAEERFVAYLSDRYGAVELDADELAKFDIVTAETIGL